MLVPRHTKILRLNLMDGTEMSYVNILQFAVVEWMAEVVVFNYLEDLQMGENHFGVKWVIPDGSSHLILGPSFVRNLLLFHRPQDRNQQVRHSNPYMYLLVLIYLHLHALEVPNCSWTKWVGECIYLGHGHGALLSVVIYSCNAKHPFVFINS